jgi:hypothetical protein
MLIAFKPYYRSKSQLPENSNAAISVNFSRTETVDRVMPPIVGEEKIWRVSIYWGKLSCLINKQRLSFGTGRGT